MLKQIFPYASVSFSFLLYACLLFPPSPKVFAQSNSPNEFNKLRNVAYTIAVHILKSSPNISHNPHILFIYLFTMMNVNSFITCANDFIKFYCLNFTQFCVCWKFSVCAFFPLFSFFFYFFKLFLVDIHCKIPSILICERYQSSLCKHLCLAI